MKNETDMTTDYRALCAELADEFEGWIDYADKPKLPRHMQLLTRTRAALAAEPKPPSDEAILAEAAKFLSFTFAHMGDPNSWDGGDADLLAFARAVLAIAA